MMDDGQVAGRGGGGDIQNSQNAIPRQPSLPASHPVPPLTLLCSLAISRLFLTLPPAGTHQGREAIAAQSSLSLRASPGIVFILGSTAGPSPRLSIP